MGLWELSISPPFSTHQNSLIGAKDCSVLSSVLCFNRVELAVVFRTLPSPKSGFLTYIQLPHDTLVFFPNCLCQNVTSVRLHICSKASWVFIPHMWKPNQNVLDDPALVWCILYDAQKLFSDFVSLKSTFRGLGWGRESVFIVSSQVGLLLLPQRTML